MSSAQYLFVYGTLQSWVRRNRYARYLADNADLIGQAMLPGRIYALKRYPALRPPQSDQDWVAGEVHRLRTPVPTLQKLDAYEAHEYRRVRRLVTLEDGRELRCWTYVFWQALPRERRIMEGRWTPSVRFFRRRTGIEIVPWR